MRVLKESGRDLTRAKGTLQVALEARKGRLSSAKTNADLIDLLMDCEKDGLNPKAAEYVDKLIYQISNTRDFVRNQTAVYNVLLKGSKNGVISTGRGW